MITIEVMEKHPINFEMGLRAIFLMLGIVCLSGCIDSPELSLDVKVWGSRGLGDGRFHKPRAIAIDDEQRLFIVDMTGRIQVFDRDQQFITSWRTPAVKMGKPCGLTVSNDGLLMVADTHYHRILFYRPDGTRVEERTIGGVQGLGEGEFGYVTDVVQDSNDNYYVSEYGELDRIQKFSPSGEFLFQWGGRGSENGQFLRPQGLDIDELNRVWVADAGNHRIQLFDATGDSAEHIMSFGSHGYDAGNIRYPYDVVLEDDHVFVCEFGNHRVQKFTREGKSLGIWGMPGREVGQMHQPWAMTIDGRDQMHVLDSYNHRVQSLDYSTWHWPLRMDATTGE